jgi:hypothetical protein
MTDNQVFYIILAIIILVIVIAITYFVSSANTTNTKDINRSLTSVPHNKTLNPTTVNSIQSGCYFFLGANNLRLYNYNDPNLGYLVQLGPNPGPQYTYGSTKWYYDNLNGIIYATSDGAGSGVVGFLVPANTPQGVVPSILTMIPGQTIYPQANGWQIVPIDNNGGVQIQYSNPAVVPPLSYILNSTPNGQVQLVSYAVGYPSDSSATFTAIRVDTNTPQCIQCTAQAQPWLNCESDTKRAQEICNDDCLNDEDPNPCYAGCAIAATISYGLCNSQYQQVDCSQVCIPCIPPAF